MSKSAIAVLLVLVAGVLGYFGYTNHQRNEQIRQDARRDATNMLQAVLPAGDDLDYASDVCESAFPVAFDQAFSGGLFSSASYDEAIFIAALSRLIAQQAEADGRPEVAIAVRRYVDR